MNIKAWIYAARPKTLVAAIIPVISSILIIPNTECVKFDILCFTLIAAIIIQITTNYINDLYDYIKGADNNRRLGPERMVQSGKLNPKIIKKIIIILIILGILCGIPLAIEGGWPIVIIGLSSFLFGYLYTAGPYPLAYHGLGDVFVFIYFGLIAVGGSYYLQTGNINNNALLLGSSIGCMNVMLLIINNIRDFDSDTIANKNTLIVVLGKNFGRFEMIIMHFLAYLCIYLLSLQLNNLNIFYCLLFAFPLSISIIYDTIYKKGRALNITLGKISTFLILYYLLFNIGKYI